MSELAEGLHQASGDGVATELATVARRLNHAEAELTRLREALGTLRDRARAVRAA
jgi:hypothetical protein